MEEGLEQIITSLREQRRANAELRRQLEDETRKIEAALDALGVDYIKAPKKRDRIENNRHILETLQNLGPLTVTQLFYHLQKIGDVGIESRSGVDQAVKRLLDEDKLEEVKDVSPRTVRVKRNLTIIPGEGAVG